MGEVSRLPHPTTPRKLLVMTCNLMNLVTSDLRPSFNGVPGVIDTSGKLWRDQRKTAVKILRDLGMGKNVLASKVKAEVATYVRAIVSKVKEGDGCLDLERLTHLSVANNICSVVFGLRYEYDDDEFNEYLNILDDYIKVRH